MRKAASFLSLALLLSACTGSVTPADTENTASDTATGDPIVISGSDTEVQLVSNLAEAYSEAHPGEADISVTGGGSSVGIAALINGTTDIANSSRAMSEKELQLAADNGVDAQEIVLARDALSIVTHPSNPLVSLSVEQLGKIYRGEVTNWKDLGGPDAAIVLYGRQSTSGTFGYFRDTVLKADYSAEMRQMEGTQAIVEAVAADAFGIGYVGVGYLLEESGAQERVNVVSLSATAEDEAVSPLNKQKVLAGGYPLARPIYQYVNGKPVTGGAIAGFLSYELSPEGQAVVEASGFYPVTAADAAANAAVLQ